MEDFLFIITIVLVIIGVFAFQLYFVYKRSIYSYKKEVTKWLNDKKLRLIKLRKPNTLDWNDSPFPKPPRFEFNLVQINNQPLKESKYKIIESTNGKIFWLEITTQFFKAPKLIFKEAERSIEISDSSKEENEASPFGMCPACYFPFEKNEIVCPDCGLHLQ